MTLSAGIATARRRRFRSGWVVALPLLFLLVATVLGPVVKRLLLFGLPALFGVEEELSFTTATGVFCGLSCEAAGLEDLGRLRDILWAAWIAATILRAIHHKIRVVANSITK